METLNVTELSYEETLTIDGGKPDVNSGFWYDVAYYVTTGIMAIGDAMASAQEARYRTYTP